MLVRSNRRQRILAFISASLISLCLGSVYSWSVFAARLQLENPDWTLAQISLIFSIMVMTYTVTAVWAGLMQDKFGPRPVALLGGLILGISMLLAAKCRTLLGLYIFHGILAGIGRGMAYATPLPTVLKWFPDKRGLAGGIISGIFGTGGLVFSYIAGLIISRTSSVYAAFGWTGLIFLLVIAVCAIFLQNPPSESNLLHNQIGCNQSQDYTPREMLKKPVFYIILLIFILGAFPGLVLTSNAQLIAQVFAGLSSGEAVRLVGIISVANGIGGPLFGFLLDKAGEKKALLSLLLISVFAQLMLPRADNFYYFLICSGTIMMCLGGLFGIFPSLIANFFGTKYIGTNYGLLFLGFGISSFLSPRIAAVLADNAVQAAKEMGKIALNSALSSAFQQVFIIGIGLALFASGLVLVINKPENEGI
ncbi:OFA family MFS transporter [Thermosyntropha sp.]|uniref:L-lactate MFS transporter n=1 Tax=Thermosyntropha sp. TaxID=2740820 RepID=UPI0025F8EED1|nr:OFA family MFS transporter [Thermosyntropha sp.]MBO8158499.1 OFA family MFS transporter [Thermosyntropha sp.]